MMSSKYAQQKMFHACGKSEKDVSEGIDSDIVFDDIYNL